VLSTASSGPPVRSQPGSPGHLAICQDMPLARVNRPGLPESGFGGTVQSETGTTCVRTLATCMMPMRAKAGPGCPFTTSADTVELAVNDPVRCIVEASWFSLDGPVDPLTSR
jgi:hypothetical protein